MVAACSSCCFMPNQSGRSCVPVVMQVATRGTRRRARPIDVVAADSKRAADDCHSCPVPFCQVGSQRQGNIPARVRHSRGRAAKTWGHGAILELFAGLKARMQLDTTRQGPVHLGLLQLSATPYSATADTAKCDCLYQIWVQLQAAIRGAVF